MSKAQPLIRLEDCALIIIDAQERLMPVIDQKELITQNLVKLAKFSQIVGLPVVVTEQQKLGPTLPEISEALGGGQAVSKVTFDCFGCQDFNQRLEDLDKTTLIITGVEAHICVCQTALMGLRSHRVQVISDAVGSRTRSNHETALRRMESAGVEVSSVEMVMYELLRQAGTDEFRQVLPLVK